MSVAIGYIRQDPIHVVSPNDLRTLADTGFLASK